MLLYLPMASLVSSAKRWRAAVAAKKPLSRQCRLMRERISLSPVPAAHDDKLGGVAASDHVPSVLESIAGVD